MKILVTGAAGFIGFHLVNRLIASGNEVFGIDNINDYYDPALKLARLSACGIAGDAALSGMVSASGGYRFARLDLADREGISRLLDSERFDAVCNLAAQAGVRYSITNPYAYADSNLTGFLNILEACRRSGVGHFVYASSSSVYGLNQEMPFSTSHNVDHPVSLYAATKKANELMAHTYSHLYGLPTTGLRFFTVYGPWGRPDMAYYKFTRAICEGRPIDVYNKGDLKRDFTYIDDIVECVGRVIGRAPTADPTAACTADPARSTAPYRVYNIGNDSPVRLLDFISEIEKCIGKSAVMNMLPMQAGDVYATWADVSDLERDFAYRPSTPLSAGISRFVEWYAGYHCKGTVV